MSRISEETSMSLGYTGCFDFSGEPSRDFADFAKRQVQVRLEAEFSWLHEQNPPLTDGGGSAGLNSISDELAFALLEEQYSCEQATGPDLLLEVNKELKRRLHIARDRNNDLPNPWKNHALWASPIGGTLKGCRSAPPPVYWLNYQTYALHYVEDDDWGTTNIHDLSRTAEYELNENSHVVTVRPALFLEWPCEIE